MSSATRSGLSCSSIIFLVAAETCIVLFSFLLLATASLLWYWHERGRLWPSPIRHTGVMGKSNFWLRLFLNAILFFPCPRHICSGVGFLLPLLSPEGFLVEVS